MDIKIQPSPAVLFVGTWLLQSYTDLLSDGSSTEPMGSTPQGFLLYTKEGIVSAQLTGFGINRNDISSEEPKTRDETETSGSYIGYCGSFTVNFELQEVVHTPIVAHDRRLVGQALHRKFELNADRLTLTACSLAARNSIVESRLVWRRQTTN